MKAKAIILVFVQLAGIISICATAWPVCTQPALIALQIISGLLLLWTWLYLKPGRFHIMPDRVKSSELITAGPFRFIRHPMYLSLILYLLPLVIEYFNRWHCAILLVFVINMIIKMYYEEAILRNRFADYAEYMKHSKRIIPFIF
jgi:protein-S-isoprenylcysteine O-methyltransferase Ste14